MSIQSAQAKDLPTIRHLLQANELPFADLTPSHLPDFLVLRQGQDLIGSVGLEICGRYGLLRSLAIASDQRGQGFGQQLVAQIEAAARAQDVDTLYLLTTTAEAFFARLGYQVCRRNQAPVALQQTEEFRSICPDSAICMRKEIKKEEQ